MKNLLLIMISLLFVACAEERSSEIPISKLDAQDKIEYLVGKRYYQFQQGYTCNLDGEQVESYVNYVEFYHADHPEKPLMYCVVQDRCSLNQLSCYEITQRFIESLEFENTLDEFNWQGRPYTRSDVNPYANK